MSSAFKSINREKLNESMDFSTKGPPVGHYKPNFEFIKTKTSTISKFQPLNQKNSKREVFKTNNNWNHFQLSRIPHRKLRMSIKRSVMKSPKVNKKPQRVFSEPSLIQTPQKDLNNLFPEISTKNKKLHWNIKIDKFSQRNDDLWKDSTERGVPGPKVAFSMPK